ncbi:MAG: GNAT family N-acetyltransferase [Ignavibacteria bacterium]|nr:GNAT family N-acetyltransferase [Ignavibacteria bacterium]
MSEKRRQVGKDIQIRNEIVHLREFTPEDADAMSLIYADDEVMKHIGSKRRGVSPAETKRMLEHFIENYGTDGFGIWACVMNDTGELTGHCGFNTLPDGMVEIAYLLDRKYWGRGIATGIAGLTLAEGYRTFGFRKIVALAYPDNTASIRVLEKIGMRYEGMQRYYGKSFCFFSKYNDEDDEPDS